MSLKVIKRQYLVVIEVNMHQIGQVKWRKSSDFISLEVDFLQVGKSLSSHQKPDISQQIILQVNLHNKLEFLQRSDLPHLIEPKIQHSQVGVGVNGLRDLLNALIPQGQLGVCEVASVHNEGKVR